MARGLRIPFLTLAFLSCAALLPAQVVHPTNGHTYVETGPHIISTARFLADTMEGHVLCLGDAEEEAWVLENFLGNEYHLGLSHDPGSGEFSWDSGEPFVYDNWAAGEPDLDPPFGSSAIRPFPDPHWIIFHTVVHSSWAVIETPETVVESVADLNCLGLDFTAEITWTNPVPYTSVLVFRNQELIATLPGDATSYVDGESGPGSHRYWVQGLQGASVTLPVLCSALLPDPGLLLRLEDAQGATGHEMELSSYLDNFTGDGIQGWSYGVRIDSNDVEIQEVLQGEDVAALNNGSGPDFYAPAILPGEGYTVGVVVSFIYDELPAGVNREMSIARCLLSGPPTTIPVEYGADLGVPPVAIALVDPTGFGRLPFLEEGSIAVVNDLFFRGDCSGDGSVDLPDVIFMGAYLFSGGPEAPCVEACEVSGDGALGLVDLIYQLSYLSTQGPPPGAPFSLCGTDPEPASSLGCATPTCE